MRTIRGNAAATLLALTLCGCQETKPQQTTTTTSATTSKVTTTQTTRAVSLTVGMKASDAIALAGIPCNPATLKSINDGANVTMNYGGHSYVFANGLFAAIH